MSGNIICAIDGVAQHAQFGAVEEKENDYE
jgi:hypothetical protein